MVKAEGFLSDVRNKTRMSTLAILFNIVLEVLAWEIGKNKKNQRHLNWKGGSKTILLYRLTLYIENPKECPPPHTHIDVHARTHTIKDNK